MPRPISQYQQDLSVGVRDDFLALMNEFLELKTVRFSEFSKVWRAKQMTFLCAGRISDRETREFLERIFITALEFFMPPFQFQVRVCGLYLLYGLFETQPITPKVKVRLTQSQWQEALQFQQDATQQNHLDVVYVFNKMKLNHAFQFCFTPSEVSTRTHPRENDNSAPDLVEDMKEDRTLIDTLFNYEAMEKLSYLLDHYQQMKVTLAGPEASQPDKSLDVVQGTMVDDLVVVLQSFKKCVGNIHKHGDPKGEPEKTVEPEKPSTSSTSRDDITGETRQALKARAYSQVASSSNKGKTFLKSEALSSFSNEAEENSGELLSKKKKESMTTPETPERVQVEDAITGSPSDKSLSTSDDDHGIIRIEVYSKSIDDRIKEPEKKGNGTSNHTLTVGSSVKHNNIQSSSPDAQGKKRKLQEEEEGKTKFARGRPSNKIIPLRSSEVHVSKEQKGSRPPPKPTRKEADYKLKLKYDETKSCIREEKLIQLPRIHHQRRPQKNKKTTVTVTEFVVSRDPNRSSVFKEQSMKITERNANPT